MNIEKAKVKIKALSDTELRQLLSIVSDELSERPQYLSNTENTPREQAKALSEFFANAWHH